MKKKIIYLINDIPFFISHRLAIANNAFESGYSINLITGKAASQTMNNISRNSEILKRFYIKELNFESSNINIIKNLFYLFNLYSEFKTINPTIVHLVSLKPIILGGIICRLMRINSIVMSFSGLGYLFTGKMNIKTLILKKIVLILLKFICKHKKKKIICQNTIDKEFILKNNLASEDDIVFIKGSGVDLNLFSNINYNIKKKTILMPSRILKNKGVLEFLEAAKILNSKGYEWHFILIGAQDYKNPSSVDKGILEKYNNKYNIKILDYENNLIPYFKLAGIVCLPSHREGMPKSILEGLASGIPIVTTNTIGCNESILPGVNGELANLMDPVDLASKLEGLIINSNKRMRYSIEARKFAIKNYNINDVVKKHLKIYNDFL